MALSDQLMHEFIECDCPVCAYPIEVQIVDVRTQAFAGCPCCHARIHLIDEDGSVFGALKDIDNAFDKLDQQIRGMF